MDIYLVNLTWLKKVTKQALKYKFLIFNMARLLAWPGYLPITLLNK